MSHKTHILEGNNSPVGCSFRCGQSAERTNPFGVPLVGCARLDSEGHKVTCAKCIRSPACVTEPKRRDILASADTKTGGTP